MTTPRSEQLRQDAVWCGANNTRFERFFEGFSLN